MEVAGAPGLPGDAIPFDGIVDLTDLNNVRNFFGVSSGAQPVPEPGGAMLAAIAVVACGLRNVVKRSRTVRRGNGDSDGADFLTWQRQLGSGSPTTASSAAVPEPGTLALLLVGLLTMSSRRRGRVVNLFRREMCQIWTDSETGNHSQELTCLIAQPGRAENSSTPTE
jgi:hypothetical protein